MSGTVDISIVVAAVNAADTLAPWLQSIRPQAARHRVEVILAAAADEDEVIGEVPGQLLAVLLE